LVVIEWSSGGQSADRTLNRFIVIDGWRSVRPLTHQC
jgi:hypothetical protein